MTHLIKIIKIFESKLGTIFLGFILTTVVGTYLNEAFHKRTWEKTQNLEFLKRKLDKQEKIIDDISFLTSKRFFHLERVSWILKHLINEPKNNDIQKDKDKLVKLWNEYYDTVTLWNENYRMYYVKLKYFFNDDVAKMFYISEEEADTANPYPKTVYGKFKQSHKTILSLKECVDMGNICDEYEKKYETAMERLKDLNTSIEDFLLKLHTSLDENTPKNRTPLMSRS